MIGKNIVKTCVGWLIILGHIGILLFIFLGKGATWEIDRQVTAALTVAPVLSVYVAAVVKNFISSGREKSRGHLVNYNYAAVSVLIPTCFLVAIAYVVHIFPTQQFSKPENLQQVLAGLEICLGGTVGFILDDLFPQSKLTQAK